MAPTLPRGIALVQWTNKDGSVTTKYKVCITRKGMPKQNKNFDDFAEANEFLAISKLKKGQEIIYKITEEERLAKLANKQIAVDDNNYSFGYFIDLYIQHYVDGGKPRETELQRRNIKNIKSLYNTIRNTSISNRHITHEQREEAGLEHGTPVYVLMYGLILEILSLLKSTIIFVRGQRK